MFKKKLLKNKQLFLLLIIYTLSHIFLSTNSFYLNFINPLFWLIFLLIFYHQDLKINKKEINITLTISIIFFILYFTSGFIFGFSNSPYNQTFTSIIENLVKTILPICDIEIMRYKLLKSNKSFRALITIIIITSEINFKALFLSHNIVFYHYLISTIIPIIFQNILFTYLSLNSNYKIPIIIRLFNELPPIILPIIHSISIIYAWNI